MFVRRQFLAFTSLVICFFLTLSAVGNWQELRDTSPQRAINDETIDERFAKIAEQVELANAEAERGIKNVEEKMGKAMEEASKLVKKLQIEVKAATNLEQIVQVQNIEDKTEKPRVLCWIMTKPDQHETKAKHVKATWGKRCDVLYFVSTKVDESLPSIAVDKDESRSILWHKTRLGFLHAYENYLDQADWFLKADDDSYVIMENLHKLLQNYNTSYPLWFGCQTVNHYPDLQTGLFPQGGAGYVLSKESLKRVIEQVKNAPESAVCGSKDGDEDVEIGRCLENVGAIAVDTRDEQGRFRFFPLSPKMFTFPGAYENSKYGKRNIYKDITKNGKNCCSPDTISFHYVSPEEMYLLEFYLYGLKLKMQ